MSEPDNTNQGQIQIHISGQQAAVVLLQQRCSSSVREVSEILQTLRLSGPLHCSTAVDWSEQSFEVSNGSQVLDHSN